MIHLADAHFDLHYAVGSQKKCNLDNVLCCRAFLGFPSDQTQQARETGEYLCDLPYHTLDLLGEYINESVKPQAVIWTGDITAHDVWKYSFEEVKEYTDTFGAWMR